MHPRLGHTLGSHAVYFDYYKGRSPDALGCEAEGWSSRLRVAAFALNMKDDTTPANRFLVTPVTGPEAEAVLEFPAYWGVENELHVRTPFVGKSWVTGSIAHPAGPSSPSVKPLYTQPVTTIFCGRTWSYDGDGSFDDNCP